MNGWELDDPSGALVEGGQRLREFLAAYPLAAVDEARTLLVLLRRCQPGLNLPPEGEESQPRLYLYFTAGWAVSSLPDLDYRKVEVSGRTITITTSDRQVRTNPAELQKLMFLPPEQLPEAFLALRDEQPQKRPPITTTVLSSRVLGQMRPKDFEDWWAGRDLEIPFFDGRTLPVTFMDLHPDLDPDFVAEADRALEAFLAKSSADREAMSEPVWSNCQEFIEDVGVEDWNREMAELTDPRGVWRHVQPQSVQLTRHDGAVYLQIACECDWEQEHGLLLTFRQGQVLTRVSGQDGLVD